MTAQNYITSLELAPHPEGGFYKETFRSAGKIAASALREFDGDRHFSTAIYYLLQQGDFSAFHKIKSDECWHFYAGQSLLVHVIDEDGKYFYTQLGNDIIRGDRFQFVVPAHCWFASEPAPVSQFSLVGCTVAPGFDFADFEMAKKENLLKQYPQHHEIISRLCR